MNINKDRYKSIFKFILDERFITLTAIGSIFTFALMSSLKGDIVDPLLRFILPEEYFGFMDVTIRDGEKINRPPMQLEVRLGSFFREFITWIFIMAILFMLAKFTRFPDLAEGNSTGAAVL